MVRAILGVIGGYIAMAVIVIAAFSIAFLVIGPDSAYRPGVFEVTPLWIGIMFGVGLVAAIVGGLVCALIATRGSKAPIALCVLVAILGSFSAVGAMTKEDPGPRAGDIEVFEAASKAKQPVWVAWSHPVVGIIGVLIGARLRGSGTGEPSAP
ncbi:MAG: hypothetical protein DHS20C14_06410 [Phycisphaeraceae bacterium]|nr:MAG: hypothetical protein DHS20C14_06410 [Phycisphaeraceae bacterium]